MKKMFRKKGQSILEYVIVLTAIVGVIIWASLPGDEAVPDSGGPIYRAVRASMWSAQTAVEASAAKLSSAE
jgi:hypothetical protein